MKRKIWSNKEKFQIVLEGLQGKVSVGELCAKYEVHQSQYYKWREQFFDKGPDMFNRDSTEKREAYLQGKMTKMQQVIGELTLELKKND